MKLHNFRASEFSDFNKDFNLFGDGSNFGLGGCLAEANKNGTLKPLSYFSKTL